MAQAKCDFSLASVFTFYRALQCKDKHRRFSEMQREIHFFYFSIYFICGCLLNFNPWLLVICLIRIVSFLTSLSKVKKNNLLNHLIHKTRIKETGSDLRIKNPDPTFGKTRIRIRPQKKPRIRILPNFDLIRLIFHCFLIGI